MIYERNEEEEGLLDIIRLSLIDVLEQPVFEDEDDDIAFFSTEGATDIEFVSTEGQGTSSFNVEPVAQEIWEDDVCSICLENLFSKPSDTNSLIETKCKHRFHASCLTSWIQGPSSSGGLCCPNCRQQIGEPYTEEVVGSPVIIKKMSCLKFK